MILEGALCKQDFMAKEIQKSGDFSSRTIMEEILLQHREKHHSSNNPKSKEKKKNQYSFCSDSQRQPS